MRVLVLVALVSAACASQATLSTTSTPSRTPTPTASATAAPSSPRPAPTAELRYVAIGASDSVGVGASDPGTGSWPARIAHLLPLGAAYRNFAVSGSLTGQARREQLPLALREQPTVVSIWLAVNDLNANVTPQEYGAELGAIVDALARDTTARAFIGTVPDLRAVPAYAGVDAAALLARIRAYNDAIAAIAAAHPGRAIVVDLFTGSAQLTSQLTVSQDGFHPSDAGYALIADRFVAAMRANGVPLETR